jgi:hypothetical protein
MNNKTFEWISGLVRSSPSQITIRANSAIGRSVIERYQSGHIKNNQLIFTTQDKTSLRQQIIQELDFDPFHTSQLPASRIEVAKHHHNEKLAKNPVSYDHILLNCPNNILRLNNQTIQLQTGCIPNAGMMCLSSGITRIDHDAIVVVENLAIMQLCSINRPISFCTFSMLDAMKFNLNACEDLCND